METFPFIFAYYYSKHNATKMEMQENNKKKSQIERLLEALAIQKQDLNEDDRKLATKKLGYTAPVISNYLNGKGTSTATAAKLLIFFKECIAERDRVLESATA